MKVIVDGAAAGDAVVNTRGDKSVSWAEYARPLKFKAQYIARRPRPSPFGRQPRAVQRSRYAPVSVPSR